MPLGTLNASRASDDRGQLHRYRIRAQCPTSERLEVKRLKIGIALTGRLVLNRAVQRNHDLKIHNTYDLRSLRLRSDLKTANFRPDACRARAHLGAAWRAVWTGASRCLRSGRVKFAPLLFRSPRRVQPGCNMKKLPHTGASGEGVRNQRVD